MVNPELEAKFKALGVDLERVGEAASDVVLLLHERGIDGLELLATCRIVEQAEKFASRQLGETWLERVPELLELLRKGDEETVLRWAIGERH